MFFKLLTATVVENRSVDFDEIVYPKIWKKFFSCRYFVESFGQALDY